MERIKEEKFDGYYAIVTSELKARPVYVSTREHIEAHFLICFVSLLLLRLLEISTNNKYSPKTLICQMRNITGTYLNKNYYMFDYFNDIVKDLGNVVGIDFSKRFMTQGQIKKIISYTKR